MSGMNRIVILGGHGTVALLATQRFVAEGYTVDSVIRDPAQRQEVKTAGGAPVMLDLEAATVEDLVAILSDAAAVVFAAGAGGGDAQRTHAVDYEAATRAMAAAEKAGVQRFVMVSYCNAATDHERLDANDTFYPYAKAKHDADAYLRQTGLDYTILGPARLTDEDETGAIQLISETSGEWPEEQRITSRANVAAVIVEVVQTGAAIGQTVNFYDGNIQITAALRWL